MDFAHFLLLMPFVAMVVLLLIGFPIAFSLLVSGVVGILIVTGSAKTVLNLVGMVAFDSIANYTLTTVPISL